MNFTPSDTESITIPASGSYAESEISPRKLATGLIRQMKEYTKELDEPLIIRAIAFAVKHHGVQRRASGDPYYYHPIAVANILAKLKMDQDSVVTAILHDTVEDTEATLDEIEKHFGKPIAQLVDGVTKLTQIEFKSDNDRQAENFRKFLLATSEDLRVLLVKLADRLHNMRTLKHIKKDAKRLRIAHETMEIYAALAERIGLQTVKDELEDIAFKELNPDAYNSIQERLKYLREHGTGAAERVANRLREVMKEAGIDAEVSGREKMPFSIWRKMQRKNVTFEQLTDIVAFRVIVPSDTECYQTLGYIHQAFHAIPDFFKDYISTPKNNGYQSIHTVVMGPEQQRIEIQIRTRYMHEVAELGVAAHWAYKQGTDHTLDGKQFRWVRELLQILENSKDSAELLESTRLQMYHDQVFAFTPKGDLIVLPARATPVDFAFSIHSEVGRTCVGAKINGRIMPLRTQLKNGDQVEILQSKSQNPSPAWEHFVVTGKALSEIRKFIRSQQSEEYKRLGKDMLERALKQEHLAFRENLLEPVLDKFGKKKIDELFIALGNGTVQRMEVLKALYPERFDRKKSNFSFLDRLRKRHPRSQDDEKSRLAIPIQGLIPGMAIHFAGCCNPLPGERITGIVNTGKGVTIHRCDCHELEQLIDSPERWLDVAWDTTAQEDVYAGRLKAVVHHRKGALADLSNAIAQGEGNIINIRITDRSQDFFEMLVDVEVHDLEHMNKLIGLLRNREVIHTVERYSEGVH